MQASSEANPPVQYIQHSQGCHNSSSNRTATTPCQAAATHPYHPHANQGHADTDPEQYNRAPYVRTKGPYRALTDMPPVDTLFKPQPLRQQLQRPAQQKVMQISTHIHPRSTPYRVVRQPPRVATSASCCGSSSSQLHRTLFSEPPQKPSQGPAQGAAKQPLSHANPKPQCPLPKVPLLVMIHLGAELPNSLRSPQTVLEAQVFYQTNTNHSGRHAHCTLAENPHTRAYFSRPCWRQK